MARKETRAERNARLRENRRLLIEAGFSPKEADRYKGASRENILKAIREGRIPEPKAAARKAGIRSGEVRREKREKGVRPSEKVTPSRRATQPRGDWRKLAPPNTYGAQKGRIVYTKAGDEGNYLYLSPYTYIVTFVTKTVDKDGNVKYERKIVALTSSRKLTKKEVFDAVYDVILSDPENQELYVNSQPILGSFELVKAVANPRYGGEV